MKSMASLATFVAAVVLTLTLAQPAAASPQITNVTYKFTGTRTVNLCATASDRAYGLDFIYIGVTGTFGAWENNIGSYVPTRKYCFEHKYPSFGRKTIIVTAGNRIGQDSGGDFYDFNLSRPRIANVTVSGPSEIRKGKIYSYRLKVWNSGAGTAQGLRLKVSGKGVNFNVGLRRIGPDRGSRYTVKLRAAQSGKTTLRFRVKSSNAGQKTAYKRVKIR